MNNWQQVTPNDAILYCERAGFKCKEIDPFEMEIKEYYLPENTKIQFKYKIQNSDPIKFYIWPRVNDKDVSMEEFKTAITEAKKNTHQY